MGEGGTLAALCHCLCYKAQTAAQGTVCSWGGWPTVYPSLGHTPMGGRFQAIWMSVAGMQVMAVLAAVTTITPHQPSQRAGLVWQRPVGCRGV